MNENFKNKRKNGMSFFGDEIKEFTHLIAGIYGSDWATPTLQLIFEDGEEQMIPCYKGESSRAKPQGFLGVISQDVQNNITPLKEE